jgi:hypothetical protein
MKKLFKLLRITVIHTPVFILRVILFPVRLVFSIMLILISGVIAITTLLLTRAALFLEKHKNKE